ncbi:MAG: hypothetical protein Q9165_007061 [Trypethelium subeluteriae]
MKFSLFLALFPLVLAIPSPSKVLAPRAEPSQCGAFTSIATGPFTLNANEWGASTSGTSGSQCSYIDSLPSSNNLAWHTTWSWAGSSTQVKTYTNVETNLVQKAVSQYQSIPTTWAWKYTVAYDAFLGTTATSPNLFEVMIWLGVYGGVSPRTVNGGPPTPIASPIINGVAFDLVYGTNGPVKVYSFVAHSHAATPFSGDLLAFFNYLAANYGSNGFTRDLVLQSVQAGSEVFTGSGAELTTTGYTISAN